MEKLVHRAQAPIWTHYMSFERAHRAESVDTKISPRTQFWAEIHALENRKTIGGASSFLGWKIRICKWWLIQKSSSSWVEETRIIAIGRFWTKLWSKAHNGQNTFLGQNTLIFLINRLNSYIYHIVREPTSRRRLELNRRLSDEVFNPQPALVVRNLAFKP